MFGPLQVKRIDWGQEMFKEEEELEPKEAGQETGKASSSGQPMELDEEGKSEVPEQVTVDATKVAEEEEDEEKPSWADVAADETMGTKRCRRGEGNGS